MLGEIAEIATLIYRGRKRSGDVAWIERDVILERGGRVYELGEICEYANGRIAFVRNWRADRLLTTRRLADKVALLLDPLWDGSAPIAVFDPERNEIVRVLESEVA